MSQPENATQNAPAEQIADPAPAEQPVVTEVVDPAEQIADPAPAEEAPIKEEQSKAVKELIAQRKKRQQAERDAAYWKGVAEASQKTTPQPAAPQPAVSGAPVEPDHNAYETYSDYERAREKYLVEVAKYELKQELAQEQTQRVKMERQQTFQEKIVTAVKNDPEFEEILLDNTLPISQTMVDVMEGSDVPPDQLIKYLNTNRDLASRIYSMSPLQVAREIGMIEAQLKSKPKTEQPKKVSLAPDPIPTITPAGQVATDESDLPMEQFFARRNKAQFGR